MFDMHISIRINLVNTAGTFGEQSQSYNLPGEYFMVISLGRNTNKLVL